MAKTVVSVRIPDNQMKNELNSNRHSINNLLTFQEVQTIVKRALNGDAEVLKYSLKSYSDGKLGFLGSHQRLCVNVKTKNGKEMLSFFVKAVPYDIPSQAEYVIGKHTFVKEITFYCDILPKLMQDYKGEPWCSSCYLAKDNLLVLENVIMKGYSLKNKLFNKELIISGLTAIARLHGLSLLAEARLGKSLKEMYPRAFVENSFSRTGKTGQWFDAGIQASVAVAEYLGLDARFIRKTCEEVYPALEASATKRNVVSHGDLWGNNLMFSNDVPPKCLLVDFQLLRYAPLAHDVAQFLYLCTDRSFRDAWEETMVKHYYNVLRETLTSANSVSVEVPPWSEITQGMEEQRLGAVITANMFFQTVLMNEDTGAEIMHDSVGFAEYAFKNRSQVVIDNAKIDPEYNRRITEATRELVEMSLRLDELPKPC